MILSPQDAAWQDYVRQLRCSLPPPFEEQWATFVRIYADRDDRDGPPLVWLPDPEQISHSNLGRWMEDRSIASYEELHRWSVTDRAGFWEAVLKRLRIVLARKPRAILDLSEGVETPRWLPDAELNCVDSCFCADPDHTAVVWAAESDATVHSITYGELHCLVNRFARGLIDHGFREGDGIALYMPMNVQCVVAYLGCVRAGCRVISIADSFPPKELHNRLQIGGARGIVTAQSFVRAKKTFRLAPSSFRTRPLHPAS
jgi:acetyl-CoA synthetase